jgi:hypothetical protein
VPPTTAAGDAPAPPGGAPTDDSDERPSARRRILLGAGLLFVVATFGVWIYALFIYDPGQLVDELEDRTFPTEAEAICAEARTRIDALPLAQETDDPVERAEVIDEANVALREMTARLAEIVPQGQGRITVGIGEWVDDWNTFIGDRQEYADALREDPSARFAESLKANRQISRAIDAFAQVNKMESCTVPGDVG